MQQSGSLVSTSREEEEEYSQLQEHCMALVEVPMAMQVDETKMIQIESPNRVLHNIITHNLGENIEGDSSNTN